MSMPDLTSINSIELRDELRNRGYEVYQDEVDMIETLVHRGYHVSTRNDFKDFLWDLYYDAVVLTPEQFMKGLNRIFASELNKWI